LQVPFPVGVKVVDVACGELHAIALSAEGVCFAWGRNTKGALSGLHFRTINELTFSAVVRLIASTTGQCGQGTVTLQPPPKASHGPNESVGLIRVVCGR
jgi:alpha-tubulin suppressor-like RCC1 family protein